MPCNRSPISAIAIRSRKITSTGVEIVSIQFIFAGRIAEVAFNIFLIQYLAGIS
jgi:hypothetical protein